jgi:hypothetical protein
MAFLIESCPALKYSKPEENISSNSRVTHLHSHVVSSSVTAACEDDVFVDYFAGIACSWVQRRHSTSWSITVQY